MRYPNEVAAYIKTHWKYDPETGAVRGTHGNEIGVGMRGYLNGSVRMHGKTIVIGLHRAAWLLMTGAWPSNQLDHRDGDRSNNQWANLREASNAQNAQNKGARKRDLPTGVFHSGHGGFVVVRRFQGLNHYAGTFATVDEADDASRQLKAQLHAFQPEQRL